MDLARDAAKNAALHLSILPSLRSAKTVETNNRLPSVAYWRDEESYVGEKSTGGLRPKLSLYPNLTFQGILRWAAPLWTTLDGD